ncbi:MAG: hypothetical protein V4579_06835 [Pseudomonadota bacterium]
MLEAKIDGVQSKMEGQIATVMAEFRTAEIKRSTDFQLVQSDFDDLKKTLPTKQDISRSTRNWALGLGGFVVAMAGLLWAFFGTGASMTGALADKIFETKELQQKQDAQFRDIQATLKQIVRDKAGKDTGTSSTLGQPAAVITEARMGSSQP